MSLFSGFNVLSTNNWINVQYAIRLAFVDDIQRYLLFECIFAASPFVSSCVWLTSLCCFSSVFWYRFHETKHNARNVECETHSLAWLAVKHAQTIQTQIENWCEHENLRWNWKSLRLHCRCCAIFGCENLWCTLYVRNSNVATTYSYFIQLVSLELWVHGAKEWNKEMHSKRLYETNRHHQQIEVHTVHTASHNSFAVPSFGAQNATAFERHSANK